MPTEVVIPKLGMTMKEGTVVEWVAPDGATVEPEQVLFVLSTDKLDVDIPAETAGTLRHGAPAGTTLPVGAVVGWVLVGGEAEPPSASSSPPLAAPARRTVASPYARRLARERGVELTGVAGSGPRGRIVAADVPAIVAEPRVLATPLARVVADHAGIDLRVVNGTGPGGRITKYDVTSTGASDVVPLTGMRKLIADRMHASLRDMAQLTLGMEVDMTDAAALRRQLVAEWEADGVKVSYTDLVCRAVAKAIVSHPTLNASIEGDVIRRHPDVHLGIAVAVDDGLLVPVVRDAGTRSLSDLSAEAARLARACRDRTVGMDDVAGATFTVSALGSNGIDFFTPIVNPPNVAILGVGRVRDGVGWNVDVPVKRQVMTLSLTIDHRALDGAPAAAFLSTVRELLESPYRLLV